MAQNDYDGHNGVRPWYHAQPKEQCRPLGIRSPSSKSPIMLQEQSRFTIRSQRTRNPSNWAVNGPKMQAVFLGPKRRSSGTGVFIPRGPGTDTRITREPGFSPVLLPSRVVQALNLNVHELGQHIRPQPEQKRNTLKKVEEKWEKEDDASFSQEFFLPEEWTY